MEMALGWKFSMPPLASYIPTPAMRAHLQLGLGGNTPNTPAVA